MVVVLQNALNLHKLLHIASFAQIFIHFFCCIDPGF